MHVLHAHWERTTKMRGAVEALMEMHQRLRLIFDGITHLAEQRVQNKDEIEFQLDEARNLVGEIQELREAHFGALSHESLLRLHSLADSAEEEFVNTPVYGA